VPGRRGRGLEKDEWAREEGKKPRSQGIQRRKTWKDGIYSRRESNPKRAPQPVAVMPKRLRAPIPMPSPRLSSQAPLRSSRLTTSHPSRPGSPFLSGPSQIFRSRGSLPRGRGCHGWALLSCCDLAAPEALDRMHCAAEGALLLAVCSKGLATYSAPCGENPPTPHG
jgi:hypothetical protein